MAYSILFAMHPHINKEGLHKINIQVIYQRKKVYAPTTVKISAEYWQDGAIIKHPNKKALTDLLNRQKNDIEKRLLDAIREKADLTKSELEIIVKGTRKEDTTLISDFIYELAVQLKGKFSEGRLKHYKSLAVKIDDFQSNVSFSLINLTWLNKFEAWLRKKALDNNTILSNMSMLKAILNRAAEQGLIKEDQFKGYKRPRYEQKLVEYLTEDELNKIAAFVEVIDKPGHKRAGYYFILSCLTGYRISDAKRFDYETMVTNDKIVLRAKKNKNIVSIPIYPRLRQVVEFVKDNPLDLSEQKVREYIKEICSFVGIKKHVQYKTARHTFAMMLINKGFSIDEVGQMLGDTSEVARVYAKINNQHLANRVNNLLG